MSARGISGIDTVQQSGSFICADGDDESCGWQGVLVADFEPLVDAYFWTCPGCGRECETDAQL